MKKGLTGPKQLTGFFDNYKALRTAMAFLIICLSFSASAQYDSTKILQDQNAYGFRWKNGKFRYQLTIPQTDTITMAVADSGSVAYYNGAFYGWNGYTWGPLGGSTTVVSDSAWSLTGNSGTTAGTNFIGTTDSVHSLQGRLWDNPAWYVGQPHTWLTQLPLAYCIFIPA